MGGGAAALNTLASAAVVGPSGPPDPTRPVASAAVARPRADPTPPALTADLCARAIIAAARAYGDDPVIACTTTSKAARRALAAAAGALAAAGVCSARRASRVLGLSSATVPTARGRGGGFATAEAAAVRAISYAAWRPEAAESRIEPLPVTPADAQFLDTRAAQAREISRAFGGKPAPAADNLARLREAVRARPAVGLPAKPTPPAVTPARPRAAGPIAGAISGAITPARFAPSSSTTPAADRPVTEVVLEALADGEARDSMSLASMVDRKEMSIISALNQLKAQGQVVDEEVDGGPRRFRWRRAAGAQPNIEGEG